MIPLNEPLIRWAQEYVCMEAKQVEYLKAKLSEIYHGKLPEKPIVCLNIPDRYRYRDENLKRLISRNYKKATNM